MKDEFFCVFFKYDILVFFVFFIFPLRYSNKYNKYCFNNDYFINLMNV